VPDRSVLMSAFVVALLLTASQSRANPTIIEIANVGAGSGEYGSTIDYPGSVSPLLPSVSDNGDLFSGLINLQVSAGSPNFAGQTLPVFCEDIFTSLNTSNPWFAANNVLEDGENIPLTVQTEDEIGWLVNNYDMNGTEADGATPGDLGLSSGSQFASATQGAIWETEYGPTLNFASGDPLATTAAGELSSFVEGGSFPGFSGATEEWEAWNPITDEYDPTLNQGQVFISTGGITNSGPPPSVPEPASLVLLGVGLIGLAAVRRRMRT